MDQKYRVWEPDRETRDGGIDVDATSEKNAAFLAAPMRGIGFRKAVFAVSFGDAEPELFEITPHPWYSAEPVVPAAERVA